MRFVLITDIHSPFQSDKPISAQHYSSSTTILPQSATDFLHECYELYVYTCSDNPFYTPMKPIPSQSQFATQIANVFDSVNKAKGID